MPSTALIRRIVHQAPATIGRRARWFAAAVLLATTALAWSGARDAEAAGRFLTPAVFSAQGVAVVVFEGGTTADLANAAAAAGADGVWVQDASGRFALLVVGAPAFVRQEFDRRSPAGFPMMVTVTLTRQPPAPISVAPQERANVQAGGPKPAARVQPGGQAGLHTSASAGFRPPPAARRVSEPNAAHVTRIVAPYLGLDHYIHTLPIIDGKMASPDYDGSYAVGWYAPVEGYPLGMPRQAGNSVFSAHETWNRAQGPFYQVHQAFIGDDIYLDFDDGERRHYQVIRLDRYSTDNIPMEDILWPKDRPADEEWITLYSCGGRIVYGPSGFGDYLDRDVLVAKWVG